MNSMMGTILMTFVKGDFMREWILEPEELNVVIGKEGT